MTSPWTWEEGSGRPSFLKEGARVSLFCTIEILLLFVAQCCQYFFKGNHKISRNEFSFWARGVMGKRFFWMDIGPKSCLFRVNPCMGEANISIGVQVLQCKWPQGRQKLSLLCKPWQRGGNALFYTKSFPGGVNAEFPRLQQEPGGPQW